MAIFCDRISDPLLTYHSVHKSPLSEIILYRYWHLNERNINNFYIVPNRIP